MGTQLSEAYCENCDKNVKIERKTPNHILHILLTICTAGLWIIVWFLIGTEKKPWICSICGKNLGGGSNGWGIAGGLLAAKPKPLKDLRRDCPYCMERIKSAAKVCKHCGRDVTPEISE